MAIETTRYLTYVEAVVLHMTEMQRLREVRFGVAEPHLIASPLARPQHAAIYENADIIRQAATLCFGLIKNHPWTGGNKRTATTLTKTFLRLNGWELIALLPETIEMVLAVEADRWQVDEIKAWLRSRVVPKEIKQ